MCLNVDGQLVRLDARKDDGQLSKSPSPAMLQASGLIASLHFVADRPVDLALQLVRSEGIERQASLAADHDLDSLQELQATRALICLWADEIASIHYDEPNRHGLGSGAGWENPKSLLSIEARRPDDRHFSSMR